MENKQLRTLSSLMNLSGRVAVITGGAGYLGAAIADTLAELGASVCLVDKSAKAIHEASGRLRDRWQVDVKEFEVDLEDEIERLALLERIKSKSGKVDILINNAAFVGDSALEGWAVSFEEQKMEAWRRAVEVNLTASFHLSQIFAPLLRSNNHGVIVNVASIYGLVGPDMSLYDDTHMANPAAYAVSKAGVIQATKWLATVLSPQIRVNSLTPGGIYRGQPKVFVDRYERRTPMRRMGTEEDFKGAIGFLATDMSSWVTGHNLVVDGGWTSW